MRLLAYNLAVRVRPLKLLIKENCGQTPRSSFFSKREADEHGGKVAFSPRFSVQQSVLFSGDAPEFHATVRRAIDRDASAQPQPSRSAPAVGHVASQSLAACRVHAASQSLVPIIQQQQYEASRYYSSSQSTHSASRFQPTERRRGRAGGGGPLPTPAGCARHRCRHRTPGRVHRTWIG